MTWRTEWKAISDRIDGLLTAGGFYLSSLSIRSEDPYAVADRELLPQAQQVFELLGNFRDCHKAVLSPIATACLEGFLQRAGKWYRRPPNGLKGLSVIQGLLTALASFRSEFTYQISDFSAFAKRLTERAFSHLQRSIVADPAVREKWRKAFHDGEISCEKLGGAHLLLHGIWAFKANAEGERTDLVLGEPLADLSEAEKAAEALVLTEWKLVRAASDLSQQIKQAHAQARRYASGIMAGFELAIYRYLVLVSEDTLEMPADLFDADVTYRHVNIAINPRPPSIR
jgi:hypothetical protein